MLIGPQFLQSRPQAGLGQESSLQTTGEWHGHLQASHPFNRSIEGFKTVFPDLGSHICHNPTEQCVLLKQQDFTGFANALEDCLQVQRAEGS